MKHTSFGGGSGGDGGSGRRVPIDDEFEVLEILLTLPKLIAKSELLNRYTFTWGRKKKRSVLVSKSESESYPLSHRKIDESVPEKVTAVDADKSPSTPLCFLPSGGRSDGAHKLKQASSLKKNSKRKATDDLMERYNGMQQQKETLIRKIKAMETLHQELRAQNLEMKAKREKINYSRNINDFQLRNNSMNINLDQQHYHQQITMFAPPQPRQQLVVDPNSGKRVARSCSSNSNSGDRFGTFNQIVPRVNFHGETFDIMASSQPLDPSKYLVMDNESRVRKAAAARKRRIMKIKENKNSLLAMKLSRVCR